MNLDDVIEIAKHHYLSHCNNKPHNERVLEHYGKTELRLLKQQSKELLKRFRKTKSIQYVVLANRFYTWYYVNYVKSIKYINRPQIVNVPREYIFQSPTTYFTTLITDGKEKVLGTVGYYPKADNFRLAIEQCVNYYYGAHDSVIVKTKEVSETLIDIHLIVHCTNHTFYKQLSARKIGAF